MQNVLIIINAPPYGSERCLSALRLATALAGNDAKASISVCAEPVHWLAALAIYR